MLKGRRFDTLDDFYEAYEATPIRETCGWYCTQASEEDGIVDLYFIPPVDNHGRYGGPCSIPLGGPKGWQSSEGANGLTVTPSIFLNPSAPNPGWHGFLTDGEWSTV